MAIDHAGAVAVAVATIAVAVAVAVVVVLVKAATTILQFVCKLCRLYSNFYFLMVPKTSR